MAETVYLDYAATTPIDPAVVQSMVRYMGPEGVFANPASNSHVLGQEAALAVENARLQIATLINAKPDEIVWTSGATESINLALKGAAISRRGYGRHIVTSCLEHSAVLDTCRYLAEEGFEITQLRPNCRGLITPFVVSESLREDTILVCLMHVNNETGTITDIDAIGNTLGERGILFHIDAAQSVARLPIDVQETNVDFVSISGHKMYGPKGVGALYIRERSFQSIVPQMHGGDQEMGLRAGTLATHQIVGMGKAAEILIQQMDSDARKAADLERYLFSRLSTIPHVTVNFPDSRVAGIVNIRIECVDNESLMIALRGDVAFSSGSACTSTRVEPSHVLVGLGLTEDQANASIRASFGRFSSRDDISRAVNLMKEAVGELRKLAREWSGVRYGIE